MKITAKQIQRELKALSNKEYAEHALKFFKTGKGEYGEGDRFLGIRVPLLRKLVKKYKGISLDKVMILLKSKYHEERMLALFFLVDMFKKGEENHKKTIYKIYLNNTVYINNWDLVDTTAWHIVGAFLLDKNRKPLYALAKSNSLWDRRIAILSTFYFIRNDEFDDTLALAEILLNDKEDLMHKAVGWMLREVGKRNLNKEEDFLKKHYTSMPRTMLRYAIEKFSEKRRQLYLKGKI
jgi:3-methyladenine DNA glycosylase AlkD